MDEFDLKKAIVKDFKESIQDIVPDFLFVPLPMLFPDANKHRVVDLLFYHLKSGCLMPIYLKFGDLHLDDIEWMKENLRALDEDKMSEITEHPIGLILCVQDNAEHVELVRLEYSKKLMVKIFTDLPLRNIVKRILKNAVRHAHAISEVDVDEFL